MNSRSLPVNRASCTRASLDADFLTELARELADCVYAETSEGTIFPSKRANVVLEALESVAGPATDDKIEAVRTALGLAAIARLPVGYVSGPIRRDQTFELPEWMRPPP